MPLVQVCVVHYDVEGLAPTGNHAVLRSPAAPAARAAAGLAAPAAAALRPTLGFALLLPQAACGQPFSMVAWKWCWHSLYDVITCKALPCALLLQTKRNRGSESNHHNQPNRPRLRRRCWEAGPLRQPGPWRSPCSCGRRRRITACPLLPPPLLPPPPSAPFPVCRRRAQGIV